ALAIPRAIAAPRPDAPPTTTAPFPVRSTSGAISVGPESLLSPWVRTRRRGMENSVGEAFEAERQKFAREAGHDLVRSKLADREHLEAVVRVQHGVDVLAHEANDWV